MYLDLLLISAAMLASVRNKKINVQKVDQKGARRRGSNQGPWGKNEQNTKKRSIMLEQRWLSTHLEGATGGNAYKTKADSITRVRTPAVFAAHHSSLQSTNMTDVGRMKVCCDGSAA